MQVSQPSLIARDDTFFGVCAGLGEDFGFNPLFLRVAFAAALFFNPLAALGAYAAAGLVVLLARLISPNPRRAAAPQPAVRAESEAQSDPVEPELVPLAA
ncbi:MAG TPA: PspC domain-containing protein [Allosphingosinicella sp.]|nr:PspC domain-containing protein [Allosphingosinicella sp.]